MTISSRYPALYQGGYMLKFRALRVNVQSNRHSEYGRQIETLHLSDLPESDLLIKVHYSSINYKDVLSAYGHRGITRHYPHTPGIDAAGEIIESSHSDLRPGDRVIVTGFGLGENWHGGLGEYIRVPAAWALKCPETLDMKDAMALGTAGFTAALCVEKLLKMGISTMDGEVLVTGATGGVGILSVALLTHLGFTVVAGTGKVEQTQILQKAGVSRIIDRRILEEETDKHLIHSKWAAAIDTVGGHILENIVKGLCYGGSVACCGLVASPKLNLTVYPLILRGVNILGVDSVVLPLPKKALMWNKLADEWRIPNLHNYVHAISLDEVPHFLDKAYAGGMVGRALVKM